MCLMVTYLRALSNNLAAIRGRAPKTRGLDMAMKDAIDFMLIPTHEYDKVIVVSDNPSSHTSYEICSRKDLLSKFITIAPTI